MNKKIYLVLIIIIVVSSVAGYLFYNQNDGNSETHQACLNSGGEVVQMNCCESTGDFPNQCKVGACGCSPENSHEVKTCDCGDGKCFDGGECVEEEFGPEANFEKEGYLVKYGKEKKWALNYEEPGKSVVTLEFDKESHCNLAKGEKPCLDYDSYGEVGDNIKVIGDKKDEVVEVDKLIYVK